MMRVEKNIIVLHTLVHVLTALCCTTLLLAAVCSRKSAKAAALDSQLLLLYISHDTCAAMLCCILASLWLLEEKFHSYILYRLLYTRIISTFLLIRSSNFKSLQGRREARKGVLFWRSDFLNFLGLAKSSSSKTSFSWFSSLHFQPSIIFWRLPRSKFYFEKK